MANNPRLARLIDLVPFISEHQGISISELAKKFGVTQGDIEKDLWLLYMCGLPGQTPLELMEFQFEDGFVTVRNADELKRPRSLTQTEIASLVIGLEILRSNGSEAAGALKDKLVSKLNSQLSFAPSQVERLIPEITQAIQHNKVVEIKYLGKVREVIPFETYHENGKSYLRAFCKLANDRRTFNVAKIENFQILAISELAPNVVPSESKPKRAKIRIHHSARLVRESLGIDSGQDEVEFFSTQWLLSQVLALGGAAELLDEDLRVEINKRIRASQALYL